VALVLEVPEEHDVHRHPVLVDQVLDDPLGSLIHRGRDDRQLVAGVQLLGRWGVEPLLKRHLECAGSPVVGEEP
jgi:hypothetical protein